jgi:aspartyl-tRNA(Asn)/glutamyl-tRNA(Gln) amidotransferase subunit A
VITQARAAEREIAAGRHRGPLHGVPVGVKDLIDTAGLRTTYGAGIFRDYVPGRDGAVPQRLRDQGAILVGKTATHELGMGITTNNFFFGPTLNPWHREHVPGGSSGGAAAAVAAELGPWQVGTDGGGSIRIPAAFCGVVGFKPTLGLISNRGQFGNGNVSFSVPGPLTRSVRDAAIAAQALAGFDPEYPYSRPGPVPDLLRDLERGVQGLRVGTSSDFLLPPPEPDVKAAYEATLHRLEGLGARIVEVAMPHHELVVRTVMALFNIEGGLYLDELIGDRPRVFGPEVQRINDLTRASTVADALRMQENRQWIARDYHTAFCEADVLVLPVAPITAPRIDADEMRDAARCTAYSGAANLVGMPSVPLPAGSSAGLPVAVQIFAPIGADALALRVARGLEQAAPEHRVQTPPLAV